MIDLVSIANIADHVDAVAGMHRLRFQVFKKRLNWDVTVSGDLEIDEYDALLPVYLIHRGANGTVDGCVRLLPTTGPYMLRQIFPVLLGSAAAPVSGRVWEASRFAIATSADMPKGPAGLSVATSELFAAMVEFGLDRKLSDMVAVVDLRMERLLRRAGWPLRRIAAPHAVGSGSAVAGFLDMSKTTLSAIREAGGLTGNVLAPPSSLRAAA